MLCGAPADVAAEQLNSISLSKNILRALNASQSDMPPLESFPKSHTVTFLYYVGIIHFLEEDYAKVGLYSVLDCVLGSQFVGRLIHRFTADIRQRSRQKSI